MSFEEMLPHLREGKYVWRLSWHTPWSKNLQEHMWYEKLQYSEGFILCKLFGDPGLRAEDLEARDWEIYTRQGVKTLEGENVL